MRCARAAGRRQFGRDVSAKDFRTWHATVLAAVGLAVCGQAASPSARKRAVSRAVKEVADYLGNTPAACRRAYIDPRLIDRYLDGETVDVRMDRLGADAQPGWPATHGRVETEIIHLLEGCPVERRGHGHGETEGSRPP